MLSRTYEDGAPLEFNSEGCYVHSVVGWQFPSKITDTRGVIYEVYQIDHAPHFIKFGIRFDSIRYKDGEHYYEIGTNPSNFNYPFPLYPASNWPNNEVV